MTECRRCGKTLSRTEELLALGACLLWIPCRELSAAKARLRELRPIYRTIT